MLRDRRQPIKPTALWCVNMKWVCCQPSSQLDPPELAHLAADYLIASLVRPGGSDLGFELIMEPNSCCYDPINKNHFYSRFFFSSSGCCYPSASPPTEHFAHPTPTLPLHPHHILTLRSCFKLLGLKTSLTAWTSIVAIQEAHNTKRFDKLHATAATPLSVGQALCAVSPCTQGLQLVYNRTICC